MQNDHRHVRSSEQRRLNQWHIQEHRKRVIFTRTQDDWELAVSCYTAPEQRNADFAYPVLLCHGLGSNRLAYDLDAQHSLALYLVELGYDVYAIDLRGHGLSEKPKLGGKSWNWGFNDYHEFDIPAAINAVLDASQAEQLHFIGHSMGGILLYTYAANMDSSKIRSGITIASTLDYSQHKTIFKALIKFSPLCRLTPSVPLHYPALLSSWATRFHDKFIDPVLVYPDNVDPLIFRKMAANVMHPTSPGVLIEMTEAINGNGLKDKQGRCYQDTLKNKGYDFPILSLSGEGDLQCSPEAASLCGTEWKVYGRRHGQQQDYGHDDLIMGRNAREEVWPDIREWLALHNT